MPPGNYDQGTHASEIKKWLGCKRAWGYRYYEGIEESATEKQAFGTAVHKALEEFVARGAPLPSTVIGNVAAQVVREGWTPPIGRADVWTERFFLFDWRPRGAPDLPEILFGGTMDAAFILHEPLRLASGEVVEVGTPVVVDYKTTSDLKYALTEDSLRLDPQALLYAVGAMSEFGARQVVLRWLYTSATNPKTGPRRPNGSRKVEVLIRTDSMPDIAAWRAVYDRAIEIRKARLELKSALELPQSLDQCSAYGGCFYRDRCPLPAAALATHRIGTAPCGPPTQRGDTVSKPLSELLAEKKAAKALTPPPAAAVEVKSPVAVVAATHTGAAEPVPFAPPLATATIPTAPAPGSLLDKLRAGNAAKGVNPAPRPVAPVTAALVQPDAGAPQGKLVQLEVEPAAPAALPEPAAAAVEEPVGEECVVCHKRFARIATHHARGACADEITRRAAAVAEVKGTEEAMAQVLEEKPCAKCEAPVDAPQLAGSERCGGCADPGAGRPIEVLLIDCLPVGCASVDLADLWPDHLARVCAEAKVASVGEIPYRAGYERATAYLLANLDARETPLHYLAVDSASPLARYALDGLRARADLVIVGCAR